MISTNFNVVVASSHYSKAALKLVVAYSHRNPKLFYVHDFINIIFMA